MAAPLQCAQSTLRISVEPERFQTLTVARHGRVFDS
jgi:hypothetical protein